MPQAEPVTWTRGVAVPDAAVDALTSTGQEPDRPSLVVTWSVPAARASTAVVPDGELVAAAVTRSDPSVV